MLESLWEALRAALAQGLDVSDAGVGGVALRTVLIYASTLFIVRMGSKRLLSDATAFDFIVGIMLGSIMSRAINGSTPIVPTLVGGAVLVSVHWLLGLLAVHTDWVGSLVKGNPVLLIRDGNIQWQEMHRSLLSLRDLREALREQGSEPDPSKIQLSYLERSGKISVVPCKGEPRVVTVPVEDGVQTIRIELG